MNIDQYALAEMTALSLLLGVFLELLFELLRFVGGIFLPRLLQDKHPSNNDAVAIIWFTVRDIIFSLCCGIAFSVFVYYTNDGNIRFIAVVGTLVGFIACYFTVGHFIRSVSIFILNTLYKLVKILVYPLRLVVKIFIVWVMKAVTFIDMIIRRNYTLRETKRLSLLKYRGIY